MGNIMSSGDSTLSRRQTRNGSGRYRTAPYEHWDYTSTKRCYFEDEVKSQQSTPDPGSNRPQQQQQQQSPNAENSRMLFLLYLIHRTWNVVVDSVDQKGKKARLGPPNSKDPKRPKCLYDDDFDSDLNLTDLDDQSSMYGSQYTFCTCSYCEEESERDNYNNISGNRFSFCERRRRGFIKRRVHANSLDVLPGEIWMVSDCDKA
ncbi:uncharacterized protein LOC126560714 [Anopheles maculipalpis]|uniref:uncharacterized protein LOC126560714 n=1 Tax=Anopheles maculipalpis TaxID=1496333 RepID=UPI002159A992|nr:uncharacterized protein LOC126560714 [Anopheles maculipalpis]